MDEPLERGDRTILKKHRSSTILNLVFSCSGIVSYEAFSIKILLQDRFSSAFGRQDALVADILWLNAHVGFGLYIFRQQAFANFSTPWRITYSIFGTTMFNFGSVLLWGTTRALIPKLPEGLRLIFGLGSGLVLMFVGWRFLQDVNKIYDKACLGGDKGVLGGKGRKHCGKRRRCWLSKKRKKASVDIVGGEDASNQ